MKKLSRKEAKRLNRAKRAIRKPRGKRPTGEALRQTMVTIMRGNRK